MPEEKSLGSNWLQHLNNPLGWGMKKFMFDMLQDKFATHEETIDRLSQSINTGKDYQAFGALVADIYEVGFMEAIKQHKSELEKAGLGVNVVPGKSQEKEDKSTTRIFKKNQDDNLI
jgi:hypothetical protein